MDPPLHHSTPFTHLRIAVADTLAANWRRQRQLVYRPSLPELGTVVLIFLCPAWRWSLSLLLAVPAATWAIDRRCPKPFPLLGLGPLAGALIRLEPLTGRRCHASYLPHGTSLWAMTPIHLARRNARDPAPPHNGLLLLFVTRCHPVSLAVEEAASGPSHWQRHAKAFPPHFSHPSPAVIGHPTAKTSI